MGGQPSTPYAPGPAPYDARASRYSPAYYGPGAPAPKFRESYYAPENAYAYDEKHHYETARALRRSLLLNPDHIPNLGHTQYAAATAAYIDPEFHDQYYRVRDDNGWFKALLVVGLGIFALSALEHEKNKKRHI